MSTYIADYDSVPFDFVDGEGCFLIDKKGKKYLDFLGGWCVATVGWKNKEVGDAIRAQADRGVYIPPIFRSPKQEALAKQLIDLAPGKLQRVFRCTSGSEAVEFALKCARAATGKPIIVSIDDVYHGHTYGAASLGDACKKNMEPCAPGFLKLSMPKSKDEGDAVISQFEHLLKERNDIAAFMSEPVWTNAGCFLPPEGFYERIQELCKKHQVLLIMDEVATGMGHCGRIYASELWGLTPDIICLAKAFTGGYATMGATLVTESVFKKSKGIPDYATFGWLEQDLAATAKNVEIVVRDRLHENAARTGAFMLQELQSLHRLKKVKAVRGIGLVFGIEFHLPIAPIIALQCYHKGLLVAFANARTLFFSPPLALSEAEARQGLALLSAACGA